MRQENKTPKFSDQEESMIAQIIIRMHLYAGFCRIAGGNINEVTDDEVFDFAAGELKTSGISKKSGIKILTEAIKRITQ
jgi:hypothetical protein